MNNPLVSIVIPCYNAEKYIEETIQSVLNQSETDLEIIVINDGSTDKSIELINSFSDSRIQLLNQKNQGVSAARNLGLNKAKGTYIVFFDADDIMSQDFLLQRLNCFNTNINIAFVCGEVKPFTTETNKTHQLLNGAANNIFNEVLMYDSTISTCPSNYMFKTSILKNNNIQFNPLISSHADRYFLLEINQKKLKGFLIKGSGELNYRVLSQSMSHNLTSKLGVDAETFYNELIKNNIISLSKNKKVLAKGFYIISGTYYKLKNYRKAFFYAMKSFLVSPIFFIKSIS